MKHGLLQLSMVRSDKTLEYKYDRYVASFDSKHSLAVWVLNSSSFLRRDHHLPLKHREASLQICFH